MPTKFCIGELYAGDSDRAFRHAMLLKHTCCSENRTRVTRDIFVVRDFGSLAGCDVLLSCVYLCAKTFIAKYPRCGLGRLGDWGTT